MKNFLKSFLLGIGAVSATNALATGGFSCVGETHGGQRVAVMASMSHSILSLGSDVTISADEKVVLAISHESVRDLFWDEIAPDTTRFSLKAIDSSTHKKILDIDFQYTSDATTFETTTVFSRMLIDSDAATYSFYDVNCEFE